MAEIEKFKSQSLNIQNINKDKDANNLITKSYNKLERSPSKDGFVKEPTEEASNSEVKKYKVMTVASTLAAVGMGAVAIIKGKNVSKLTSELADASTKLQENAGKIGDLEETISKSSETISNLNKQIEILSKKLTDALNDITQTPEEDIALVQKYKKKMLEKISKVDSIDTPLPPKLDIEDPLRFISKDKIYKLSDVVPYERASVSLPDGLNTSKLKEQFSQNGHLDFCIDGPIGKIAGEGEFSRVSIGNKNIQFPHKQTTNMAMKYADGIVWSNQKIARDMLQNFFDGHGQTLNGVRLNLQTLADGKVKVCITGKGLFSAEDITLIGGGNKIANASNAGGFGEGAKVMICKMIRDGKTDNVRFRCADWSADFYAENKVLMRELNKSSDTLMGNTLEFETKDRKLIDALIDGLNYFKHSKNPDYQKLSYESPDFAFKMLEDGQKGNVYLTQRFEVGQNDLWDGAVDNMGIIFKKKADIAEMEKITGYKFNMNRDRTKLTAEEIQNLTHYFAHKNMSDEELMKSIVSTRHLWATLRKEADDSIHFSFIKGLLNEAKSRKLGLDIGETRYAYLDCCANDVVKKTLLQYGYTLLPENFKSICVPKAIDVFKSLSNHISLPHSAIEAKKIKLLDEAVAVIKKDIDNVFEKFITNFPEFSLNEPLKSYEVSGVIINWLKLKDDELLSIFGADLVKKIKGATYSLTKSECKDITSQVAKCFKNKLKTLNKKEISDLINNMYITMDEAGRRDISKLKNLLLIEAEDITRPKYIFDRLSEKATGTLGEAIIDKKNGRKYLGHWIDRSYFKDADFNQMLATWLHEIHHKSGGDGSAEFTYALTDLIEVLLNTQLSKNSVAQLKALGEVYNSLNKQAA